MNRRGFLGTLAAVGVGATAGCVDAPGGDVGGPRRLSLAEGVSVPAAHDLRIDVEVLEPASTDAHPARIRVTTANEGPRRALSIGTGMCHPFNREEGASDDPRGLWLHRPEDADGIDREPGRWVRDVTPGQPRGFPAYGCLPTVYAAGETVRTEYEVWADYQTDGYLVPGTYRWRVESRVWDGPDPDADSTAATGFTWGFALRVEAGTDTENGTDGGG